LDFERFTNVTERVRLGIKLALLWYAENRSTNYMKSLYDHFRIFYEGQLAQRSHVCDAVTLRDILDFRNSLDQRSEWKLGFIRILLEAGNKWAPGLLSNEGSEFLDDVRIKGNDKGTSVRMRDPKQGAFTDTEILTIQSSINGAYASGAISLYQFAIIWLVMAYGARPVQIAALKEKDLVVSNDSSGKRYALRIPRAKQRGENVRASSRLRYCSEQIGQLLESVIRWNEENRPTSGRDIEDWPMFMSCRKGSLPGLRYHVTANAIGMSVRTVGRRESDLKSNAKRFRITLAQRAVNAGKDKYTVAELLDHSDTQNVAVYYEADPSMVLRIDRHLAMEMAPLAQAFAGIVVSTEVEAKRGDDRSSRVRSYLQAGGVADPLGTCGQMSFCGLSVPFSCYTCRHFQPWLDGPHDAFLAALIADRERMINEQYSPKIYSIRDRTIFAVAQVIQNCESEMEKRGRS
jgi:integrase